MSRARLIAFLAAGGLLVLLPGCQGGSAPSSERVAQAPARPTETAIPTPPSETSAKSTPATTEPEPPARRAVILPERLTLRAFDPGVQFLVSSPGVHGGSIDRTNSANYRVEPAEVATIEPGGYLRPKEPGQAKLIANTPEGEVIAQVTIENPAESRPWDFDAEIVPMFSKLGCNAGGCHGKADGQNGFHLSLFGYDPEGDHRAITRDAGARRISTADPELSLLILKATGVMPHGGGRRIVPGSDAETMLIDWIAAGAPRSSTAKPDPVVSITVEPPVARLDEPGKQQFRVLARHESGRIADVTRQAVYKTNDDTVADVDGETGLATLKRRAEADLVIRYQSHVVAARIATPFNPDLSFDFATLPRRNVIDTELFKRLESLKVPPSPPASDAAFLRRVTLDLTGQLPETAEIREFLADKSPDKREKKVDELLTRREFSWFWRIKFGDLLQVSQARFQAGAGPYQYWLTERLNQNAPWDKMVRELLTSLGDPTILREGGPVNYALDGESPQVMGELAAQRFLGLRIRCAQCHDHPFDLWTQDDYYGFAAFFAKIDRGNSGPPGANMGRPRVKVNPDGKVEHLRTKQVVPPRLLGGEEVRLEKDADPRVALADWITRPDNPYFARATVNWLWAQFFGKGIVDPPDDLSVANPPVHPELLGALAKHFVEHKYDIRDLIRTIATSEAYGLGSKPVPGNEQDNRLFSHHLPRPLTAHQMADALAQATDVPNVFPNRTSRSRTRAIEIFDPGTASTILDTFGRCPRTNGCSTTGNPQLTLRQALLVIGGDVVDGKVSHLNGYLANMLSFEPQPSEIVENLYLRALCRLPTAEESSHWGQALASASNPREAAEDLFWALLNSREFAFNH